MHNYVELVFKIIIAMTISLILWVLVMGPVGRAVMWNAMNTAYTVNWNRYTFNSGDIIETHLTNEFNTVSDLSTN